MLNRKTSLIVLSFALIFFFIYMFSYPRTSSLDSIYGFDESNTINYLFPSVLYGETGSFKYPVPYQGQLPRDIELAFTPRDAAQYNGYIVPKFFLGALVIWGTIASFDKDILLVIQPLMATFIVLALFLITRKLFSEKIALITSAIAFVFPVVWLLGLELLYNRVPAVFFFLLGLYYFIKLSESKDRKYYFLTTLFLASSIFTRYDMVLMIPPLLFYLVFIDRGIALSRKSLIAIAIFAFSLAPILLLNKELFGNFFVTGYQVEANNVVEATGYEGASYFFAFKTAYISRYIQQYMINFAPLLTLGFILGLFVIFRDKVRNKYFAIYALYAVIILSLFHGGDVTYGFDKYYVNSAFSKHLLIGYSLMMPLLAIAILEVKRINQKAAMLLISTLLVTSIVYGFTGPGGVMDNFHNIEKNREFYNMILQKTEPNSVIVVSFTGKFLFPVRNTLYAPMLAPPDLTSINIEDYRLPDIRPDPTLLARKAAYMVNQGIPVYITELMDNNELKDLKNALSKDGFTVKELGIMRDNQQKTEVYKIVPAQNAQGE